MKPLAASEIIPPTPMKSPYLTDKTENKQKKKTRLTKITTFIHVYTSEIWVSMKNISNIHVLLAVFGCVLCYLPIYYEARRGDYVRTDESRAITEIIKNSWFYR
jgi:hypothetical protein